MSKIGSLNNLSSVIAIVPKLSLPIDIISKRIKYFCINKFSKINIVYSTTILPV